MKKTTDNRYCGHCSLLRRSLYHCCSHCWLLLFDFDTVFYVTCRWAHIGCAVAMPEVFFVDVNLREGINTDQITSARKKLVSGIPC